MKVHEAHVCDLNVGHRFSKDCWCEPVRVYWVPGLDEQPVCVVEHNDDTSAPHILVSQARSEQPDWVTVFLDEVEGGDDE